MSSVYICPPQVGQQAALSLWRRRRGMTLLEVMIATFVLFVIAAGVLDVLMSAYKLTLVTRHSDNARAVLVAFGDQFTRSNPLDLTNPTQLLASSIWQPTGVTASPYGTGDGMTWGSAVGNPAGLQITLGASNSSSVPATLYRKVDYVQTSYPYVSSNGTGTSGTPTDMLSGTFTIVFTVNGQQKTESLTVARLWRNAN